MKVLKFGGTSLGSAKRMKNVAELVTNNGGRNILVLSAVSGTTNSLVAISEAFSQGHFEKGLAIIEQLDSKYQHYLKELLKEDTFLTKAQDFLTLKVELLKSFAQEGFSLKNTKEILAQGELISTQLMCWYLAEKDVEAVLLSSFDFMRTREQEPDHEYIKENLQTVLGKHSQAKLFIAQGYICLNEEEEIFKEGF